MLGWLLIPEKDDRNHGETFLYLGLEFVVMDCITHSIQQKSRIFVCVYYTPED